MTISLNPYLQFDGQAREAMEFYHDVFGGELSVTTFAEGMPDGVDETVAGLTMHASLLVAIGLHLMASDTMPGMKVGANGTISLSSDGPSAEDAAALQGYWDKLTVGATIEMPLALAPWGDSFGQLTDRFGVSWMVDFPAVATE